MKKLPYKLTLLMMLVLLLNNCQEENSEYPCSYKLVEITKNPIEVYTKTDTVGSHNFTVENIIGNDWLNKNTINEINFKSSKTASLKFNESELKEALDYLYSDLSIIYKNDSIFFKGIKIGLNDENDTVSLKGIVCQDTIKLFGVFFALNNAMPQGVEYGEFDKYKILELGTGSNDTLALFHFALKFEKNEK